MNVETAAAATVGFFVYEGIRFYRWLTHPEEKGVIYREGYGRQYAVCIPALGVLLGIAVAAVYPSLGWGGVLAGYSAPALFGDIANAVDRRRVFRVGESSRVGSIGDASVEDQVDDIQDEALTRSIRVPGAGLLGALIQHFAAL